MISILSLLRNVDEPLNISIMTMEYTVGERKFEPLTQEFARELDRRVKLENSQNSVVLYNAAELFAGQPPKANLETRFTPCCMLRLYADLIPEIPDRIMYLDNDVICRRDFSEFYHQDMSEYEVSGVLDHYGKWFFRRNIFRMDYLNSGVLLLNMEKIRQSGLFRKCRQRCEEKKMFMPDQSAINKLAAGKKLMPRRYNEQRKLMKNTVFQHFTTSFRFFPWIHTVSVKPWDIERMHSVLRLHKYDELLAEFSAWKSEFEKRGN